MEEKCTYVISLFIISLSILALHWSVKLPQVDTAVCHLLIVVLKHGQHFAYKYMKEVLLDAWSLMVVIIVQLTQNK